MEFCNGQYHFEGGELTFCDIKTHTIFSCYVLHSEVQNMILTVVHMPRLDWPAGWTRLPWCSSCVPSYWIVESRISNSSDRSRISYARDRHGSQSRNCAKDGTHCAFRRLKEHFANMRTVSPFTVTKGGG